MLYSIFSQYPDDFSYRLKPKSNPFTHLVEVFEKSKEAEIKVLNRTKSEFVAATTTQIFGYLSADKKSEIKKPYLAPIQAYYLLWEYGDTILPYLSPLYDITDSELYKVLWFFNCPISSINLIAAEQRTFQIEQHYFSKGLLKITQINPKYLIKNFFKPFEDIQITTLEEYKCLPKGVWYNCSSKLEKEISMRG